MRSALVVLAVVGALVVGVLLVARSFGAGPLAEPAAASRVYVAISRSDDETDAREIEVVDVATGERQLFAVNGHITALALSRDRRTLFAGTNDGRVLLLDARTGSTFRTLTLRRPVFHVLPLADTSRAAIVTSAGFALWDVGADRELNVVSVSGSPLGRPAQRGGDVLLPVGDPPTNANDLLVITLEPLSVGRTNITRVAGRVSGTPQVAVRGSGAVYLAQYDGTLGGARLHIDLGEGNARDLLLAATTSADPRPVRSLLEVQLSLALEPDATIDACIGNAEVATRYRVKIDDARAQRVGGECGQLVVGSDGTPYLAVRGKPQLAILSREDGRIVRSLALPGIAVLAAT